MAKRKRQARRTTKRRRTKIFRTRIKGIGERCYRKLKNGQWRFVKCPPRSRGRRVRVRRVKRRRR